MPFDNIPPRRLLSVWAPPIIVRRRWWVSLIIGIGEAVVFCGFLASLSFFALVAWAVVS